MSDSGVIGDVTQTLADLLTNHQAPLRLFDVSLRSPADETVPGGANSRLNLFLFRVVENPFLKNQEWLPEGSSAQRYPPMPVDLFYILTAFASDGATEHRVLGEAMRVLHDFSIIEGPDLKGGLENSDAEVRVEMWQLSLEDLSRIWSALTKPYRLSVGYVVRNILIDSTVTKGTGRVVERQDGMTGNP